MKPQCPCEHRDHCDHKVQSERLFQAIGGNGGIARLVILPLESHGYLARESVLHVLAEQFSWLDRWLGPADSGSVSSPTERP